MSTTIQSTANDLLTEFAQRFSLTVLDMIMDTAIEREWTLTDFEKRGGVPFMTVVHWYNQPETMGIQEMLRLLDALDVDGLDVFCAAVQKVKA